MVVVLVQKPFTALVALGVQSLTCENMWTYLVLTFYIALQRTILNARMKKTEGKK